MDVVGQKFIDSYGIKILDFWTLEMSMDFWV